MDDAEMAREAPRSGRPGSGHRVVVTVVSDYRIRRRHHSDDEEATKAQVAALPRNRLRKALFSIIRDPSGERAGTWELKTQSWRRFTLSCSRTWPFIIRTLEDNVAGPCRRGRGRADCRAAVSHGFPTTLTEIAAR